MSDKAATRGVLEKKVFLEISQNSQENTCARAFFLIKLQGCNFIKKETLTQVFSCEFCEISKNTFSTEHLQTTASSKRFLLFLKMTIFRKKRRFVFQNSLEKHLWWDLVFNQITG